MEKKIWLKSADSASRDSLFKSDYFKNAKAGVQDSVMECLYFDTADLDLLKNNVVLMACSGADGVSLKAVFENSADMEPEYIAELPPDGIDLSRFSDAAADKLKAIIGGEQLQIQLASSFELKTRGIAPKDGERLMLIQTIGCFEDNGIKGELSILELKGLEGDLAHLAGHVDMLIGETKLMRCPSPWIESMRIKASGFQPAIAEKRLKGLYSSELTRIFSIRLFELIRAYTNAGGHGFEKERLHRLRTEARKTLSLIEAFRDVFDGEFTGYTCFLESLLDDTDEVRELDMLEEELDIVVSAFPRHDLSAVQQLVAAKRVQSADELTLEYENGKYVPGLLSLWAGIQRMHAGWESAGADEKAVKTALKNVKAWFGEMNKLKRADMARDGAVHDFRIAVKKTRYTLEDAKNTLPKRLERALPGLKKLQSSFGIACDTYKHLETLERAAAEADKETAYQCGVCFGILATDLRDDIKEAYAEWKDFRYKNSELAEVF